ncbi:hypothetical protein A3195_03840 [Candidatus Thiodiazotropha endoloripes]|nr:hypothetical protein A3193_13115 [Candidatus Thiodiazotropha endoloripes]ODB90611.1 hypothetical protein A3195_03840 [Candidatus Thiodiazotropha endoloripes]
MGLKNLGIIIFLCFNLSLSCYAGKLYKWVDDEGRTHYSDKLPPSETHRARSHLDQQGITVKQVDAAKSDEELRQEQEQERLRLERQRVLEKQQALDRVLLRTFRTEDDILMTRNGQLQAVETHIRVTQSNIKRLKSTLDDMEQFAAQRELSGKPVSKKMLKDIDVKRQALQDAYSSIIDREHHKNRIRQSFAMDLKRFRELKKLNSTTNPIEEADESFIDALQNVFNCQSDMACNKPWRLAKQYLKKHSTTAVKIDGANIVITAEPVKEGDISISMSRIEDPKKGSTVIFMDLQCKKDPTRNMACEKTPEVMQIKAGFQQALLQ